MSADKGKSYLPQIKAAYQALNEANANKLICAVRLGDVLNQAAETIKASYGKGAWGPWLEMNCPEITHRTANVYMTLEAFSQRAAIMGTNGDLSIRGAIDAVNKSLGKTKPPSKKPKAKPKAKPEEEGQNDNPEGGLLEGIDVDEVLIGIDQDWEADQRNRLLAGQLKYARPLDLVLTLENVWDLDSLRQLIEELKVRAPNYVKRRPNLGNEQPAAQPSI